MTFYNLAPAQKRIWLLSQFKNASKAYNNCLVCKIEGELDVERFIQSISNVLFRHKIVYSVYNIFEGELEQKISPQNSEKDIRYYEFLTKNEIDQLIDKVAHLEFDLEHGPLFDISLVKESDHQYTWVVCMHHIISDGVSFNLFATEVWNSYQQLPLADLAHQYVDYIDFLNSDTKKEEIEKQKKYWLDTFQDHETLKQVLLPFDYKRVEKRNFEGSRVFFEVENLDKLKKLAFQNRSSISIVLLTCYSILVQKLSGVNDFAVVIPTTGRNNKFSDLIGMFVNTLPIRVNVEENLSFNELLKRVTKTFVSAYENQDYPFESLISELKISRDINKNPLSDIFFAYQETMKNFENDKVKFTALDYQKRTSMTDLLLEMFDNGQTLKSVFEYDTSVFKEETIFRLVSFLKRIINQIIQNPSVHISEISVISEAEEQKIFSEFNAKIEEYKGQSIVSQLQNTAASHSEKIALLYEGKEVTFEGLWEASAIVASFLKRQGIRKGDIVSVCSTRSIDFMISIWGILRCGAAYLPLDPRWPVQRMAKIIESSQSSLLLFDEEVKIDLSTLTINKAPIQSAILFNESDLSINDGSPDDLLNVIYTSGSTGAPKGVMVEQRSILNRLLWAKKYFDINKEDIVLFKTPYTFDVSVPEMFMSAISGCTICILPSGQENDPAAIVELIKKHKVTTVHFVPSMLGAFLDYIETIDLSSLSTLRYVYASGEALPFSMVERFNRTIYDTGGTRLYNLYGPTEAAVEVSYFCCSPVVHTSIPIGKPIDNLNLYVLDHNHKPVPVGLGGELYISGVGVARGYLNDADLTNAKFIPDVFQPGQRMYKTGDLAKWVEDGNIEYLGRIDNQVKIRGYRIELGEIEAKILEFSAVKEAVVIDRESSDGHKELVAYLIPASKVSDEKDFIEKVKESISANLPEYMIPRYFILIDKIPVTPHGKVDRKALPAPVIEKEAHVPPSTQTQKDLCNIWEDLLGISHIGIEDNFFSLGGDSIKAIQMVARAHKANIRFTLGQLFENQTITKLAGVALTGEVNIAEQGVLEGRYNLTTSQRSFLEGHFNDLNFYNQSRLLELTDTFDESFLEPCLKALFAQHDILRTKYWAEDQEWKSEYGKDIDSLADKIVVKINLDELEEEDHEEAIKYFCDQAQSSLDISNGLLVRVVLFSSSKVSKLFIVVHHLALDDQSWKIFLSDFESAYQQYSTAQAIDLGLKGTSLRQYSAQLEAYARKKNPEKQYWIDNLQDQWSGIIAFDYDEVKSNRNRDTKSIAVKWNAKSSAQILNQCNRAYHTNANDLLLSALFKAIEQVNTGSRVRIFFNEHSRPALNDNLDVSKTLGWFSYRYPLTLDVNTQSDWPELITSIKEQRRSVPLNGFSYSLLKEYTKDQDLAELTKYSDAWLSYDFLGEDEFVFKKDSCFKGWSEVYKGFEKNPEAIRENFLSLKGRVKNGELHFELEYNELQYKQQTIAQLFNGFKQAVDDIIQHCVSKEKASHTPSDFPLVNLLPLEIEELEEKYPKLEDVYPATGMQQGLLFHSYINEGAYVRQLTLAIQGDLNTKAWRESWELTLQQFSIFRTAFAGDDFSNLLQVVSSEVNTPWVYSDWESKTPSEKDSDFRLYVEGLKSTSFDIQTPPLVNLHLIKFAHNDYRFIFNFHHALLDGWSYPIVWGRQRYYYENLTKGVNSFTLEEPYPYKNYINWLHAQDKDKARIFWRNHLSNLETPTFFPLEKDLVGHAEYNEYSLLVPEELRQRLQEVAKELKVTLNTIVQGAWAYLLFRYTQNKTISFGTTVSGRPAEIEEIENIVGLFMNTIPSVVEFDQDTISVAEYLRKVQQEHRLRDQYNYLPLSDIKKESLAVKGDLFDNLLIFENFPIEDSLLDGGEADLNISAIEGKGGTNYKLSLVAFLGGSLSFKFGYNLIDFSTNRIERIATHFITILKGIAEEANAPLFSLNLIGEQEQHLILSEYTSSKVAFPDVCVHEIVEQIALETPDATALKFGEKSLNYRELNEKANRLAGWLIDRGIKPDSRVGIYMDRSMEMIIAILATMKSGGAYVPVDIDFPVERLHYILKDSDASILLVDQETQNNVSFSEELQTICLDGIEYEEKVRHYSAENISTESIGLNPSHLAYVIYTSGSTGNPKGVMISHGSLVDYAYGVLEVTNIRDCKTFGLVSSIAADLGNTVLYTSLLIGGSLEIFSKADVMTPDVLFNANLDCIKIVPSHWKALQVGTNFFVPAKCLVFGGEQLGQDVIELLANNGSTCQVFNHYGPTETTVGKLIKAIEVKNSGKPPLGLPFGNTEVYLLNNENHLTPFGIPGEICIGGVGLSRGYINNEELTECKFVSTAYSKGKVYRTGDIGLRRLNGDIEFLGRKDDLVKVRGYRIELGEIERCIISHEAVNNALVLVKENADGNKFLVAYLEPAAAYEVKEIRSHILRILPEYMMPSHFIKVGHFPLLPNGKIDRKALQRIELTDAREDKELHAARNETEKILLSIWGDVLKMKPNEISIHDSFIELGGDSLKVIRVLSGIKDHGLEISAKDLYASKTIAEISAKIQHTEQADLVKNSSEVKGYGYLLPFHLTYFDHVGYKSWNISSVYALNTRINEEALGAAVSYAYRYHDALRINFKGEIKSKINFNNIKMINLGVDEVKSNFIVMDWSQMEHDEFIQHVMSHIKNVEKDNSFQRDHLANFILFRGKQGDHFYMMVSHLICDAVSFEILRTDIFDWYEQLNLGKQIKYRRKTDSYIQATKKIYEYANSSQILDEIPFWHNVYESFNYNKLIPTDALVPKEQKKWGNISSITEDLLVDESLASIEAICAQHQISLIDLALTVLGNSICEWAGIEKFGAFFITAGRQFTETSIDIGRTVGCFAYANHIKMDGSSGGSVISKAIAYKANRNYPANGGLACSLLLNMTYYKGRDCNFNTMHNLGDVLIGNIPNISVNYYDRRHQAVADNSMEVSAFANNLTGMDPEASSMSLFNIIINHTENEFSISWGFNKHEYNHGTIEKIVFSMRNSLAETIREYSALEV